MSKKLQLSIPKPCHENWDAMSPVEKGKFCGSCQKQVVDFSHMTDREVALFFKKPTTGSVCGRFMEDQLNRTMEIPKKRIPWLKYFLTIGLPAFFAVKASAQVVKGKVSGLTVDTTRYPTGPMITLGLVAPICIKPVEKDNPKKILPNKIGVNGKVVNEEGEPVPFASVKIINNQKIMTADEKGQFKFNTGPEEKLIELEITSAGFKPQQYIYPMTFGHMSLVDITVQMTRETMELDEVIVTSYPNTIMGGISVGEITVTKGDTMVVGDQQQGTNGNDTLFNKIADWFRAAAFRVYPNPTHGGSTIHIEWKKHEGGDYKIELISAQGQLVFVKEMAISKEQELWPIELPVITPGIYILKATNKKSGKAYSEKIVVQ